MSLSKNGDLANMRFDSVFINHFCVLSIISSAIYKEPLSVLIGNISSGIKIKVNILIDAILCMLLAARMIDNAVFIVLTEDRLAVIAIESCNIP